MKILAGYCNGTLRKSGRVAPKTVMEIKEWQKQGNLFGLVTGKDYRFIEKEMEQYGISCDFLVCSTGAAVYDKHKQKISSTKFTNVESQVIVSFLAKLDREYILFSGADETYFWGSKSLLEYMEDEGVSVTKVNKDTLSIIYDLCQISIKFSTISDAKGCASVLVKLFGNVLHANQNADCVDITPIGTSKYAGLQTFLHASGNGQADVLTFGDWSSAEIGALL